MKLLEFPKLDAQDIPTGLRNLADLIETGSEEVVSSMHDVQTLVWVTLDSYGNTEIGALGKLNGGLNEARGIALCAITKLL